MGLEDAHRPRLTQRALRRDTGVCHAPAGVSTPTRPWWRCAAASPDPALDPPRTGASAPRTRVLANCWFPVERSPCTPRSRYSLTPRPLPPWSVPLVTVSSRSGWSNAVCYPLRQGLWRLAGQRQRTQIVVSQLLEMGARVGSALILQSPTNSSPAAPNSPRSARLPGRRAGHPPARPTPRRSPAASPTGPASPP